MRLWCWFFLSFAAFDQKTCDFEIKFINSQTRNVYFKHFKYQVLSYVLLLFIIHQVSSFCGKTIFTFYEKYSIFLSLFLLLDYVGLKNVVYL